MEMIWIHQPSKIAKEMCLDYAHEIWDLIAPVNYLSLNPSD